MESRQIAGMAVLSETMQAMGLVGEVGRTGRWIRFPSRRGVVYVVASAWGAGYQAFCEPCTTADQEIYLDPVSAIRAGLRKGGGLRVGGSAASDGC